MKIMDFRAEGFQRTFSTGAKSPVNCLALHPNEAELICGNEDGLMLTYDLNAGDKPLKKEHICPEVGIRTLSYSLNATYLAMANSAGQVYIWSLNKAGGSKLIQKFKGHEDYILSAKISPGVKFLATCGADKTAKLWKIDEKAPEKGFQIHKELYGHNAWVWDGVFTCDDGLFITVSTDLYTKIWETEAGELVRNFSGHQKGIVCIAMNDIF